MNAEIGNLSFVQCFRKSFHFQSSDRIDLGMNSTAVYRSHLLVSVPSGVLLTYSTQFRTLRSWVNENPLILDSLAPKSVVVVGNHSGLSVRISLWDFILILLDRGLQSYAVYINVYFRTFDRFRSFICIGGEMFDSL